MQFLDATPEFVSGSGIFDANIFGKIGLFAKKCGVVWIFVKCMSF